MKPAIGPKQGKFWGETQLAFGLNGIEAYPIHVVAGGFCSRHRHEHKWNRFYVLSGALRVLIFNSETIDKPDVTIIRKGEVSDVPPGVRHEFLALEDTIAVEFYWTELDANDIVRDTVGGIQT